MTDKVCPETEIPCDPNNGKHCPTCHSDNMWAHGQPCYYCGKPVNNFAGNPSEWNVFLCHKDDPGRIKPHHVGCIDARLHHLEELLSHADEIKGFLRTSVERVKAKLPTETVRPTTVWGKLCKAWSESRG